MRYEIRALPATTTDTVRASGLDASGNPVQRVTATGGEPLRCCLRDATAGEEMIRRAGAQPQRRVRLLHVHGRTGIGAFAPAVRDS